MKLGDLNPLPALIRLPREQASTRVAGVFRIMATAAALSRVSTSLTMSRFADDPVLSGFVALFLVSLWLTFLGLWTRISSKVLFVAAGVIWLYYGQVEHVIKEYYPFQILMVIAFLPAGRSFSLDRLFAVRRARARGEPAPAEWGPRWGLELACWGLFVLYVFAAKDKITPNALAGADLERIWMGLGGGSDDFALYPWLEAIMAPAAWLVFLSEAALALVLLHRGLRHRVVPFGIVFHLVLWLFINPWQFTMGMCAWWVAALDPARFHVAMDRVLGRPAVPKRGDAAAADGSVAEASEPDSEPAATVSTDEQE